MKHKCTLPEYVTHWGQFNQPGAKTGYIHTVQLYIYVFIIKSGKLAFGGGFLCGFLSQNVNA